MSNSLHCCRRSDHNHVPSNSQCSECECGYNCDPCELPIDSRSDECDHCVSPCKRVVLRPLQEILKTRLARIDYNQCSNDDDRWRTTNMDYGSFCYRDGCCDNVHPDPLVQCAIERYNCHTDTERKRYNNRLHCQKTKCKSRENMADLIKWNTGTVKVYQRKQFCHDPKPCLQDSGCDRRRMTKCHSVVDSGLVDEITCRIMEHLPEGGDDPEEVLRALRCIVKDMLCLNPQICADEIVDAITRHVSQCGFEWTNENCRRKRRPNNLTCVSSLCSEESSNQKKNVTLTQQLDRIIKIVEDLSIGVRKCTYNSKKVEGV
ncbi:hypothetical protein ACOME3_005765 [Neoechinorhynchus agilis]